MTQVGTDNIPVSGSKAAMKRKERLEFQVPAHDLDASLCHNLSENEVAQLTQYVEKIKENSVGQGVVVRLGDSQLAKIGYIDASTKTTPAPATMHSVSVPSQPIPERIVKDKILSAVLTSQPIHYLLHEPSKVIVGSKMSISKNPLRIDIDDSRLLSIPNKNKLKSIGINTDAVESYVTNEPIYEQIFNGLSGKRVRFEDDCILGPINKFREEYHENGSFKNEMQEFVERMRAEIDGKAKKGTSDDIFNSPLALEPIFPLRKGALMHQETPVRKINFATKSMATGQLSPAASAVRRDQLLSNILNSDPVRSVIYYPTTITPGTQMVLQHTPMQIDFAGNPYLSGSDKRALQEMGVDSRAVHSAIINGPIYDKLFADLDDCAVDYENCCILQPMKALRLKYATGRDHDFKRNVDSFAAAMEKENPIAGDTIISSKSTDSGFDSAPPTPNYSTHPMNIGQSKRARPTPVVVDDDFNLVALLDSLELEELPPPPPVPLISDGKRSEARVSTIDPTIEETVEPLKAITKCKSCKQDIYAGTVAVKAERAGKEVAWHPQCFTCHSCGDLLADLVYFYHGGNIYCGRDLANILKIPRCNACDELIFTKEYTAAEGATFHIKHFCCYQCDTPLAGQQYIPDEKTNMPLCLKCYDDYHAEKCQKCMRIIGPAEEGVNWEQLHWHKNCFECAGVACGKSLIGGRFCIKHNLPFCSPKCVASVRMQ